jgi:hypothetical protein
MERDPEQTLLVEERLEVDELRLDVEERLGQEPAARVDDADETRLLDHGPAAGAVRYRNHRQRMSEAARDFLQLDFQLSIRRNAERQRYGGNGSKGGKDEAHLIPPVF